ncbi:MAG TPA: helix-turn-helix transcriptional regulator [Terriglobia bacterium]|jgi:MerR family transcriptional regulator/heat shock protein HspR|nr:helix-turn-helix transcriptional regulator [Terriglobia bacterium]
MAKRGRKTRGKAGYMISAVAELYNIHPQTLRLYEREGLLVPSRSQGNTRLYTQEDLERLETILNLTRNLGVNLAGIEIILNMRARMKEMQEEMQAFVDFVQKELMKRPPESREKIENALVRVAPPVLTRLQNRREG